MCNKNLIQRRQKGIMIHFAHLSYIEKKHKMLRLIFFKLSLIFTSSDYIIDVLFYTLKIPITQTYNTLLRYYENYLK